MKLWRKIDHLLWLIFCIIGSVTYFVSSATNNPYDPNSTDPQTREQFIHWQVNAEQWHTLTRNCFLAAALALMIQKFILPRIPVQRMLMSGLGLNYDTGAFEIQPADNPHFGRALLAMCSFFIGLYLLFGFVLNRDL